MERRLPWPGDNRRAEFLAPRLPTVRDREPKTQSLRLPAGCGARRRPEVRTYPSSQTGVALQATGTSPEA
jgi:hypothetical protein